MREILFRGKQIDTGAWVEGAFCMKDCDDPFGELVDRPSIIKYEEPHSGYWFRVDPETVGQFTGLTDKNGKKIFEGDLLNGFQYPFYRSESAEHNYFAEVIWFTGNCAFCLYTHKHPTARVRGISAGNADFIEDFNSDDWEVIGNIHDNPELLGGAEDGK